MNIFNLKYNIYFTVWTIGAENQYGVYSETSDKVPIVGTATPQSHICYLLGCNAWGQTVLSYASTLIPGILGFKPLTIEDKLSLSLLTVRRFQLLPCVQGTDS